MNIQISGNQVKIDNRLRSLVKNKISLKLDKLLSPFSPQYQNASLHIRQQIKTKIFQVNFKITLPPKKNLFASTKHIKLESALIDLEQQIEKQIKRYKESLAPYSLG